ncbi:MAG: protein-disulfide isomerase, partial [Microbacterium sp.]|nr:protein-disulfide isomerase [Microbacterium sp.]
MSNDDDSNVPASRDRREAVREKAQQVQAKHARLRALRLAGLGALALVLVVAVITGVTIAVNSAESTPVATPQNVTDDGGIPIVSVAGVSTGTSTLNETAAPTEAAEPTPKATPAPT